MTESEDSKCASQRVKSRLGHDAQGNGDPRNYVLDGDEKKWDINSLAYNKELQRRMHLSAADVTEKDWSNYPIVHVQPNPEGNSPGERTGIMMGCSCCNTNFNPWKENVSGKWGTEDIRGDFYHELIKRHRAVCGMQNEDCPCGCGYTIQTLTQQLGNKSKATAHIHKQTKDYVAEAEAFKSVFGDLVVPRSKGRRNDGGDVTWSKTRCQPLNMKLSNIKRGLSAVSRAQRDRLIIAGVPANSNIKLIEDL